jgi:hypothetical protein
MTSTTSSSNVSLTVVLQPTQSVVPTESYLYQDALYDALGMNLSDYTGSPQHRENTLFLWESGCRTGETWNCTLACSDTEAGRNMVWNSSEAMFTLHNCLVYPVLATAVAHEWLVQDPPDLLDKFGISSHDLLTANATTGKAELNESAWPVINGCLQRVCAPFSGSQNLDQCTRHETQSTTFYSGPQDDSWNISLVRHLAQRTAFRPIADNDCVRYLMDVQGYVIWVLLPRTQTLVAPE